MTTAELEHTMLAWTRVQLDNYVKLSLLNSLSDLDASWRDGAPLLCLAHCFFPDSVPDLVGCLRDASHDHATTALQVFQDQLSIEPPVTPLVREALASYLNEIQKAVESKGELVQTMRLTQINLVTEVQQIKVTRRSREETVADDEQFEQRASSILHKFHQLRNQLNEMSLLTAASRSTAHEEEGDAETATVDVDLATQVQSFEANLNELKGHDMVKLEAYIRSMSEEARASASGRIQAIYAAHNALELQLKEDFKTIQANVMFNQLAAPIRAELEFVQTRMLKTTTTEEGIRELEERMEKASGMIADMEKEHQDLISGEKWYRTYFDALKQKHQLIESWVDEVRVWYLEAERIQKWIEERIKLLESNPVIDALETTDIAAFCSIDEADRLNSKFEVLENEVEKFDKEDMARLRAHVKALTAAERSDKKDLSPADTTTIEITFATLTTLEKLMHMLRRRSYELQMLLMRLFWEQEHKKAIDWVQSTAIKLGELLTEARWKDDQDDTSADRKHLEAANNSIVQKLLDLEQQASEFDQGQFTTAVNMYQDMDDISKVVLPSQLESRQVALEEGFEELTKRLVFARQIVEQRLAITEFTSRASDLELEGEQLAQEIEDAKAQVKAGDSDQLLTEKIKRFQEQVVQVVTTIATLVRYPDAPSLADHPVNEEANTSIHKAITARKSKLILLGTSFDQRLNSYRNVIQLQNRAQQLLEETTRLGNFVAKRIKALQAAELDILGGKYSQQDMVHFESERNSHVLKVEEVKNGPLNSLKTHVLELKSEVEASEASVVDCVTLDNAVAGLQDQFNVLDRLLAQHTENLNVVKRRLIWETQTDQASKFVSVAIQGVWDIIRQASWRPDDMLAGEAEETLDFAEALQSKRLSIRGYRSKQGNEQRGAFKVLTQELQQSSLASGERLAVINHVEQRQAALEQSEGYLEELLEYGEAIWKQTLALNDYMNASMMDYNTGREILDDIELSIQRVMVEEPQSYQERITNFEDRVMLLQQRRKEDIPFPVCSEEAWATRASSNDDDDVSATITSSINKQEALLAELCAKLRQANATYEQALQYKRRMQSCTSEAEILDARITAMFTTILSERRDPSSSIFDTSSANMGILSEKHKSYVAENDDVQSALGKLCEQFRELRVSVSSSDISTIELASTDSALSKLESRCKELDELVKEHGAELHAIAKRIEWQNKWNHANQELQSLQESMREFTHQLNIKASQDLPYLDQADMDELNNQATKLRGCLSQIKLGVLESVNDAWDHMIHAFDELSKRAFPPMLIERHGDLLKRAAELEETWNQREAALERLFSVAQWERDVEGLLAESERQEQAIEDFIVNSARWSPGASSDIDGFETLQKDVEVKISKLSALLERYHQIAEKLARQKVARSETANKRKSVVESAKDRLDAHLAFAKQVIDQRNVFNKCLQEAEEIRRVGQDMKERFMTAEDNAAYKEELRTFSDKITAFCEGTFIPFPIRQFKNHDPRCRTLDLKANAIIQETLQARQAMLKELPPSLNAILKNNERDSRHRAEVEGYMRKARAAEEWISAKHEQLIASLNSSKILDVEQLRAAVASVDGILSALTAYNDAYNSVTARAESLKGEESVDIKQNEVQKLWNETRKQAVKGKEELAIKLHEAERKKAIDEFKTLCQTLQNELESAVVSKVTDEDLTNWRDSTQSFKLRYINAMQDDVNIDDADALTEGYTKLCATLDDLARNVSAYRLGEEYAKHTTDLESFLPEAFSRIRRIKQKCCSAADHDTGSGYDGSAAVDDFASIQSQVQSYMDRFEEQKAFHKYLQVQGAETDTIAQRQAQLLDSYATLGQELQKTKKAVDAANQWSEICRTLKGIVEQARTLQKSVESLDNTESKLQGLDNRLDAAKAMADKLDNSNEGYKQMFDRLYDDGATVMEEIRKTLSEKKLREEQQAIHQECLKISKSILETARKESAKITERMHTTVSSQTLDDDVASIENGYRAAASAASASDAVCRRLGKDVLDLERRAKVLTSLPGQDNDSDPVSEARVAIDDLCESILAEKTLNDFVRRMLGHAKSGENIITWISNCHTAIQALSADMDMSADRDTDLEMGDIRHKMDDFLSIIVSFRQMTKTLLDVEEEDRIKDHMDCLKKLVHDRAERIEANWNNLQQASESLKSAAEKTTKGVAVVRKMKNILSTLNNIREEVNGISLFDHDIEIAEGEDQPLSHMLREQEATAAEQALNAIESEAKKKIVNELDELDRLIAEFDDIEGTFIQQRAEMDAAMASVMSAVEEKKHEIAKALEIGKTLAITDDIEVLLGSLEDQLDRTWLPEAAQIGEGLSKADVQAKAIELDARHKYCGRKIVQSLEAARLAAEDISEEANRTQVLALVNKLETKWVDTEERAKTRKAELNKMLEAAPDQQQSTRRVRKSSLPTRKASNLLRDKNMSRLAPPMASQSNTLKPSISKGSVGSSTSSQRSTARYTNQTHLAPPSTDRPLSRRPLKSVSSPRASSITPKPNNYVPDPQNDLDVQVGRIVNETPYKVKVKMVPGEVGRYWFGEMNPKLAYCRVLKSKMVMVRVGGGWLELSEFLRNHAFLEGDFIPKATKPEDQEPALPSIQEGFIETWRRGRMTSVQGPPPQPINESRSTPQNTQPQQPGRAGYKEGDRYITMDRHGNPMEVKMTRAGSNNAKNRNSSSNTNSSNSRWRTGIPRKEQ